MVLLRPRQVAQTALVADEALKAGYGSGVVALPMPKDDYEEEFGKLKARSEESIRRFEELFQRARNSYVVRGSPKTSEEAYMELGREIARCSHLVLALWDGGNEDAPGGTRWVVEERLGHHVASCEVAAQMGAVAQIVVHRSDCPASLKSMRRKMAPAGNAARPATAVSKTFTSTLFPTSGPSIVMRGAYGTRQRPACRTRTPQPMRWR